MNKRALFRVSVVFAVIVLTTAALWFLLPQASAQKEGRHLLDSAHLGSRISSGSDDDSLILLNATEINARSPEAQAARKSVGGFEGKRMHLFRFSGPIQPAWRDMLVKRGLEIIDYIPNYTYLVYGDANAISGAQAIAADSKDSVEWEGPFKNEYRVSPDVYGEKQKNGTLSLSSDRFGVQLYKDDAANADTLKLIDSLKTSPVRGQQEIHHYVNLVVGLDEAGIKALSERPDVISIHRFSQPSKLDERQDIILAGNLTGNAPTPGDYMAYLTGKGFSQTQFDTSGFLVDISDSPVDNGTTNPNHFAFHRAGDPSLASRVVYSRLEGVPNSPSSLQGCDGHGTLNASIIMGNVPGGAPFNAFPHADASLFRYGLGVAPFVKLGSSIIFDPNEFTFPNYANLQSEAFNGGARISSNSWGEDDNTYNVDSQSYDFLVRDAQPTGSTFATAGNQQMVIVFSAGNAGSDFGTVGSPGTAKNVITVGASEGVQAFGGQDQCGVNDSQADSAFDIIPFSSRGPTFDQRKKPDIMLPGSHISGVVGQQNPTVGAVGGIGGALTCFTDPLTGATGVCGGTGTSNFWPLAQQWYSASSGTSHSTPAIAGLAALIRQDFINRALTPPSPAMTKGIIMNSAAYMTGAGANDSLPSNNQGMGLANMNNYLDIFARANIVRDQLDADRFTASGQSRAFTGTIVSGAKPFRVTLAWTDTPGSTTAQAFVNNLDLEVTIGGQTYRGNVFNGPNSAPGGNPDARNNVESVFLPAGVTGNFVVKVKATNIAGDGVPNNADALDQDFALVVSNANATAVSVVQASSLNITAESGTPANGSPDPGETVTVNLGLQEVGAIGSGTVTATLQNSGGVTPVTVSQNYGSIGVGSTMTKPFTFIVPSGAACSSSVTLTFLIQDGVSSFNFAKTYQLGTPVNFFSQNFDGVTVPALPAGWVNTQTVGTGINWTTISSDLGSPPNAAFAVDADTVSAATLESPAFTVNSASAVLTFSNLYDTEASSADPSLGYDGMVLDIKIGAGAYQDILAAGGTFNSGGYNRTISTGFGNPIGGRQAWAGVSNGTISTSINLPAAANGQTVKLRWTMASDSSFSFDGVRIDNVSVLGPVACATVAKKTKARADFDGDGKSDESVFRPSVGNWFALKSKGGVLFQNWGIASDILAPGDYDNDGVTDVAIFRQSDGQWYIVRSSDSTIDVQPWGTVGDIPVAGDYDGDGKTDKAIFRPSNGNWFILGSTSGAQVTNWGIATDKPVPGDYDGDGKTDVAIFRPTTGDWFIIGSTTGAQKINWGVATDRPVPADYDGDGKDDLAIFRPSTGDWFVLASTDGVRVTNWGVASDIVTPGDYDGDGKTDAAIFRPSTGDWFIVGTTSGVQVVNWGINGDIPVPAKYIP